MSSLESNKEYLANSLLFGTFECVLVLGEYVLISYVSAILLAPINALVSSFIKLVIFVVWFLSRGPTKYEMISLSHKSFSSQFFGYISMLIVWSGCCIAYNPSYFDLSHLSHEGALSWSLTFEYLLFNPIKEELLFRALIVELLSRRTKLRGEQQGFWISMMNGVLFGAFHLMNLFGRTFGVKYVILQAALCVVSGTAYSLQILATKSIFEVIIMHSLNNSFAALFRKDLVVNMSDMFVVTNFVVILMIFALSMASNYSLVQKRFS